MTKIKQPKNTKFFKERIEDIEADIFFSKLPKKTKKEYHELKKKVLDEIEDDVFDFSEVDGWVWKMETMTDQFYQN